MKEKKLKKAGVLAIYLIGSQARRQARSDSDIDLVAVVKDRQKANLRQLVNILAEKYPVEKLHLSLVDLNHTSPLFLYQIAKEGELLFASKESFPPSFVAAAMQRYFHDQHRFEIFRRELIKKFRRRNNVN